MTIQEPAAIPAAIPAAENTTTEGQGFKEVVIDGVRIRYEVTTSWDSGHNFSLDIDNESGKNLDEWEISFVSSGVNSVWNADMTKKDDVINIHYPSWNTSIAAGDKYTIGGGASGTTISMDSVSLKYKGQGVNTPPKAVNDTITVKAGEYVRLDVLANDSDADNDTLTIDGLTSPEKGTAVVANGKIIYTADEDAAGQDSFKYTVSDGKGAKTEIWVFGTQMNQS